MCTKALFILRKKVTFQKYTFKIFSDVWLKFENELKNVFHHLVRKISFLNRHKLFGC